MQIIILVLYTFLIAAKAEINNVNSDRIPNSLQSRIDDFAKLNEQKFLNTLQNYETSLECLKYNYMANIQTINDQTERLITTLMQIEDRLDLLKVTSDVNKNCVNQYAGYMPTRNGTKALIERCVINASNQVAKLLKNPLSSRDAVRNYYENNFRKQVANCGKHNFKTATNYTLCITAAASDLQSHLENNQKVFNTQIEAAEITAKANIKSAEDCSYKVHDPVLSLVAGFNLMINRCIEGKNDCQSCGNGFTCPDIYHMNVDNDSDTIFNPFFQRQNRKGCLMLKLSKK